MDGHLVIRTSLENKQLQKDLAKAKRDLEKFVNEEERLMNKKAKLEIDIESSKSKIQTLDNQIEELNKKIANPTRMSNAQTSKMEMQVDNLIQKQILENQKIEQKSNLLSQTNSKIAQNVSKQEKLNTEILKMNSKLKLPKADIESVGNSINKVIKKVAKWTLALFGVRAVYGFIRQSVSLVSSYNDKIAGKLEAIKIIVATALEPIINKIVNLLYTGLSYLIPMLNSWFRMDVLADAQANALKKSNNNAKQLQKTLAGFDEMNIVNENGTINGVSSTLEALKELQKKIDKIQKDSKGINFKINFGDTMKTIGAIALALGSGTGILGKLGKITGTVWIVKIAIEKVEELLEANEDLEKSSTNLKENLKSIGKDSYKVADKLSKKIKEGTVDTKELNNKVQLFKNLLSNNNREIDATRKLRDELNPFAIIFSSADEAYKNMIDGAISSNDDLISSLYLLEEASGFTLGSVNDLTIGIENQITSLYKEREAYKYHPDSEKYVEITKKIGIYKEMLDSVTEAIYNEYNSLITTNEGLNKNSEQYKKNTERIDMLKESLKKLDKINPKIEIEFDANTEKATKKVNSFWDTFQNIGKKTRDFFKVGNANGGHGFAKGGIVYSGNIPKLASGGIINRPGQGVPIASAIGGERGHEAVVPLTDSQQMELLGQSIGRYITINANIINEMNGRVISRELQKIQNNQDFMMNR